MYVCVGVCVWVCVCVCVCVCVLRARVRACGYSDTSIDLIDLFIPDFHAPCSSEVPFRLGGHASFALNFLSKYPLNDASKICTACFRNKHRATKKQITSSIASLEADDQSALTRQQMTCGPNGLVGEYARRAMPAGRKAAVL